MAYIYVGLAGETGRGRDVHSGLHRMRDGDNEWQPAQRGLPDSPAVRAIAVHPLQPNIVYAGTQSGPYRSNDHGEHWERVNTADHNLPVWSFLFHPSWKPFGDNYGRRRIQPTGWARPHSHTFCY